MSIWTNGLRGASEGTDVINERFSLVPAMDYSTDFPYSSLNHLGDYKSWYGENIYGCTGETNAIVLGKTPNPGYLLSGPLYGTGSLRIRLALARHTEKDSWPVLVELVTETGTNEIGQISLPTGSHQFREYVLDVDAFPSGAQLLIRSQLKSNGECSRVAIRSISAFVGFCKGEQTREHLTEKERALTTSFGCPVPTPTVYFYSIAPFFSDQREGEEREGSIDMSDPPWMRCWQLSQMPRMASFRELDLSGLIVLKKCGWTNGVDGIHACWDSGPIDTIYHFSEKATNSGIYLYNAGNDEQSRNELALLGTSGSGVSLILVLQQDAARPVKRFRLSYDIQRVVDRSQGGEGDELTLAWSGGSSFDDMNSAQACWHELPAGNLSKGKSDGLRSVFISDRDVRQSKYIFIRWRVPKESNSSLIGIARITVSEPARADGLALIVR